MITLGIVAHFDEPDVGEALVFDARGLPPGFAIDAASGSISDRLSDASAGVYTSSLTARDPHDAMTTRSFQGNAIDTLRGDVLSWAVSKRPEPCRSDILSQTGPLRRSPRPPAIRRPIMSVPSALSLHPCRPGSIDAYFDAISLTVGALEVPDVFQDSFEDEL